MLETRGHRNLFYLTAVPLFLLSLPRLGYRDLWGSALARLALAYLGYFFIAALWSDGLTLPALGNLLRVTLLALLFFVTASLLALRDRGFERRLYVWLSLVAGASLLAVFTALLAGTIVHEVRLGGFGIASHPVIGATLYGFVLLTSAFVLLPRSASWPARLLWLGVIGLCTAFMLLSGSRGPLIALAAALVLGLAIADRRIAIAVACLFAAGLVIGLLADFRPFEMLFTRGESGHFAIWREALDSIAARPWFGFGSLADFAFTGKNGPSRSPHNLLLANQLYGGLPATLLLAALIGTALWRAGQAARDGATIYLVLLAFGLTASLFDSRSLVQNIGREWITLWLPLALLAARELAPQGSAGPNPAGRNPAGRNPAGRPASPS